MPATYEPIATYNGTGSSGTISFVSITSTYTDLVLIANAQSTSGARQMYLTFNGDTGANYSRTILSGTGSTAVSARNSNAQQTYLDYYGIVEQGSPCIHISNIMNYSNTTTNKTMLTRANDSASGVDAIVHLWRSTAAINRIDIYLDAVSFATGSTFTLYGIKGA
jgi:hypothetical protein